MGSSEVSVGKRGEKSQVGVGERCQVSVERGVE